MINIKIKYGMYSAVRILGPVRFFGNTSLKAFMYYNAL